MDDLKSKVSREFNRVAKSCGAAWQAGDTSCEFRKNGFLIRVRWSIERIDGVFVTLAQDGPEFGLPYLVEFMGGTDADLAAASSDRVEAAADVVQRYALPLLEAGAEVFDEFARFAEARAKERVPTPPAPKATGAIRPGWR